MFLYFFYYPFILNLPYIDYPKQSYRKGPRLPECDFDTWCEAYKEIYYEKWNEELCNLGIRCKRKVCV